MLAKLTENRDQPSKELIVSQNEKERLMERVEDLEAKLNRESVDHKEAINEFKKEKEGLLQKLDDAELRLQSAIKENKANDKNASAQAAADMKLQISRIQQQFKEEKQAMEANHKRSITNYESDINIKEGILKKQSEELSQIREENDELDSQLKDIRFKEEKATSELKSKEEEFAKMAESLGKQAQDKALLKMEHMQLK